MAGRAIFYSANWNLYLNIWIRVLPMLPGVFAVLNGKLRAAVQTAKTHYTFVLDPYGPFILHFNGLYRAFLCAKTAAYTVVLNLKIRCATHFSVIKRLCDQFGKNSRCARRHVFIFVALLDAANDVVNILFC